MPAPPEVTEFEVPEAFTALADAFKFEILVRERSGNQTAIESCFEIEKERAGAGSNGSVRAHFTREVVRTFPRAERLLRPRIAVLAAEFDVRFAEDSEITVPYASVEPPLTAAPA